VAEEFLPPVDEGNPILEQTAARLSTSIADGPQGERMILTIRTTSGTLTVFLNGPDAKAWAQTISSMARQMSGGGLIVAKRTIPNGVKGRG
jgi:hypothetical protein